MRVIPSTWETCVDKNVLGLRCTDLSTIDAFDVFHVLFEGTLVIKLKLRGFLARSYAIITTEDKLYVIIELVQDFSYSFLCGFRHLLA